MVSHNDPFLFFSHLLSDLNFSHACSLFVALEHFLFSHWLELSSCCPYYTQQNFNPCSTRKKLKTTSSLTLLSRSFQYQAVTNVSSSSLCILHTSSYVSSSSYHKSFSRCVSTQQNEPAYFIHLQKIQVYEAQHKHGDRSLQPVSPKYDFGIRKPYKHFLIEFANVRSWV